MYTYDELRMFEEQERELTKQIKMLQADRRIIRKILRDRQKYEEKIGRKVADYPKYITMTKEEIKNYNRKKQQEHRKKYAVEKERVELI